MQGNYPFTIGSCRCLEEWLSQSPPGSEGIREGQSIYSRTLRFVCYICLAFNSPQRFIFPGSQGTGLAPVPSLPNFSSPQGCLQPCLSGPSLPAFFLNGSPPYVLGWACSWIQKAGESLSLRNDLSLVVASLMTARHSQRMDPYALRSCSRACCCTSRCRSSSGRS